jgi:hypothetical protein
MQNRFASWRPVGRLPALDVPLVALHHAAALSQLELTQHQRFAVQRTHHGVELVMVRFFERNAPPHFVIRDRQDLIRMSQRTGDKLVGIGPVVVVGFGQRAVDLVKPRHNFTRGGGYHKLI